MVALLNYMLASTLLLFYQMMTFKGLNRLTILNLSGAGLLNISDNAFRGLQVLRELVLTDNRLKKVPTKQLSILNRLRKKLG
uniref:Insulin-like protein growth factor-binding protein complex acid labile subunit n=1 Tax=Triatoma infestans TaxID=30076 RepID=A0A161M1B6_TRIIF